MQVGLALTENNSNTTIQKYRKVQIQWEHIPRANCSKGKSIAEKATKILSDAYYKFQKQGYVIYNHTYLSKLTKCKHEQNARLLRQLGLVFNIHFFKFKIIDRKIYRNIYIIQPHENTFEILNNTKNYFAKKLSTTPQKNEDSELKIIDDNASKNSPVYITNKIIINNNRSRANFCKNVDKLENTELPLLEQQPEPKPEYRPKAEPKILNDFYPLTEELANEIRVESGRNFSLNAMNEILKDIAKRLTHCIFRSIKGFKAYMVKILKNEMRDENKVNNETFRITANLTEEEKKAIEIEKYLTKIENIREVSQEVHLKKKLACVLKPETAYELLKNYRGITVEKGTVQIKLYEHVELTELEKDIVLSQVKATHETLINGVFTPITGIKYTVADTPITFTARAMNMLPRNGVWGNIRNKIVELLGKDGDAIDSNIFSKLEAEIDEQNKQIKLKAPINHLKVMIEDVYMHEIRSASLSLGFTFKEIYC